MARAGVDLIGGTAFWTDALGHQKVVDDTLASTLAYERTENRSEVDAALGRGVANGYAGVDADGDVVDADGEKVLTVEAANAAYGAKPAAYLDPREFADGAITALGRGTFVSSFGNSPFEVSGDHLIHVPTVGSNSAAYLQAQLPGAPGRISAVVDFPAGSDGSVSLIAPLTEWADLDIGVAGVHVTIRADGYVGFARYDSGLQDLTTREIGSLAGARHTLEVILDPVAEHITVLVDGTTALVVANATAFTQISDLVIWELFESTGTSSTPATLASVWADTVALIPASGPVSGPRGFLPPMQVVEVSPGSGTTIAIGTSFGVLSDFTLSATYPDSGKILCVFEGLVIAGTAPVYMRCGSGWSRRVAESGQTRWVHIERVRTGTPGAAVTVQWEASCASGSPSIAVGGSYAGASARVSPIPA